MKKTAFLVILLIICTCNCNIQAQNTIDKKSVSGSWLGKLNISGVTLRIVFNLSVIEKDSLAVTLDSPDQGAKGLKVGPVELAGDKIKISASLIKGEYNGTFANDTLINGTWSQAGSSWPLDLSKMKTALIINRPQEPKPPFPYLSEDVIFKNEKANINLGGTLTLPDGNGPFPAVILITGSGSQNRNEELMGHKPFLLIADYLTRHGIAVFRYDDRGVGQSQLGPAEANSADFATDAEAALNYLKTRPKINPQKIGLAGHSEGGLIAPICASTNHDVAFIVSLAGTGVRGEEILNRQNYDISKATGMSEQEINKAISMNKKLFAIVKKEPDNKKAEAKMMVAFKEFLEKEKTSGQDSIKAAQQFHSSVAILTSKWFRYFLAANPADFWKKVTCPVLALNGEKDLQVAADVNLPAIEKALKKSGNNSVTIRKFAELNHLFQHCKTGAPSEYGEIEETMSPEVLKTISDWILAL
jgi:uncharacterized protein